MAAGYIYIFQDAINDNIIKIGLSTDTIERHSSLYTTSTPKPFLLKHVWIVQNMTQAERVAHMTLEKHRINGMREFFYIIPMESWGDDTLMSRYAVCNRSAILDHHIEAIEENFFASDIQYKSMRNEEIISKHQHRKFYFPEGINSAFQ